MYRQNIFIFFLIFTFLLSVSFLSPYLVSAEVDFSAAERGRDFGEEAARRGREAGEEAARRGREAGEEAAAKGRKAMEEAETSWQTTLDNLQSVWQDFWTDSFGLDVGEMGMGMVDLSIKLGLVDSSKYDTGRVTDRMSRYAGQALAIAGTAVVQNYVLSWGMEGLSASLTAWLNEAVPVYHYSKNAEAALPSMLKNGIYGSTRVEGGLPQLFDKMAGREVTNLWMTKYAPEAADRRLVENLFVVAKGNGGGEIDFALKSYATRREMISSVINNPAELFKTAGVQYGSFVRNLEGKAVSLSDFEIVPLTKNAQAIAREISAKSGGKIVVNDLTNFSTSVGAKSSYYLHAGAIVVPGVAIYAIPTTIVSGVKNVSGWLKNKADSKGNTKDDIEAGAAVILALGSGESKDVLNSQEIKLLENSTNILILNPDQVLSADYGLYVEYYNSGHLVAYENKTDSSKNFYRFYDNDVLVRELSGGVERNFKYSADGLSVTETVKTEDSQSIIKDYSFDPNTDKLTKKDSGIGTITVTYFDKSLNPLKVIQTLSDGSVVKVSINSTSTDYSVTGRKQTLNVSTSDIFDSRQIIRETLNDGTSTRKIIMTKYYSDAGDLLRSKSDYFDGNLKLGTKEVEYSYKTVTQKDPITGRDVFEGIPIGSSIIAKRVDGSVLYKDQVQFSEPDSNGIRSITKGPITMKFNASGQLIESSIDKNSDEFKANFAGLVFKDSVSYSYDKNGKMVGINDSSGIGGDDFGVNRQNKLYYYIIGAVSGALIILGGFYYVVRKRNLLKKWYNRH